MQKLLSKQFWLEDWGVLILVLIPVEAFMAADLTLGRKSWQPQPEPCKCHETKDVR